ncbi:MAG: 5-(carboxyamino)imidazole ribonucleotide mutase [Bdellovibrionales bacterium]|nr:5-(carboxyamino)imidazole ribonucleotide mutase [Bdellovibrionales bacterium]
MSITADAKVAIIMGSDSDWKIMKRSKDMLDRFGIACHQQVVSAHRTPHDLAPFAAEAEKAGIQVIIAGAGGAAHLPGMIASFTRLPVIGVPIQATPLQGLDALLSIAQMPEGIPVACMSVENAGNAGLYAARILSLADPSLQKKLIKHRDEMAEASRKKTENLKG